jgi:hypothetical protein
MELDKRQWLTALLDGFDVAFAMSGPERGYMAPYSDVENCIHYTDGSFREVTLKRVIHNSYR